MPCMSLSLDAAFNGRKCTENKRVKLYYEWFIFLIRTTGLSKRRRASSKTVKHIATRCQSSSDRNNPYRFGMQRRG